MNPAEGPPKRRLPTPAKAFATVFLGVFLVVFVGSGLLTFLLPETFVSVARVRTSIPAQSEIFQSPATLSAVSEELGLSQVFAQRYGQEKPLDTERTLEILRRAVQVRRSRGTNLVEIRVYSSDPAEAAWLANAIAQAGITNLTKTAAPGSFQPEIVERAVPASTPARPNRVLNLILGALVGAFLGIMAGGVGARLVVLRQPPPNQ